MPYTLAISNRKGGTGKTTVAVNLAAELSALGLRILLVDLDSQNHCAVGLGVRTPTGRPTVHDLFREPGAALAPRLLPTSDPKVAIVPADPLFEHGSGLRDPWLLSRALEAEDVRASFDVVLLDTPPSLDLLLLNALNAAHGLIVPYVPHPLSLEGVRQLMRVLFKVKTLDNPGLKILGFLPVMVAEHVRQHQAITGAIAHQFGAPRVLPGIRTDIKLAEAFGAGQPIRVYAPRSRAAEDFRQLGETVSACTALLDAFVKARELPQALWAGRWTRSRRGG